MSQGNWRWCSKCQMLHYAGGALGPCPQGGSHTMEGSGEYFLVVNNPNYPGQSGWRWCQRCKGLFFSGISNGECDGNQPHDSTGSGSYRVAMNSISLPGQTGWRWCQKCQSLWYSGTESDGACFDGGHHTEEGSSGYRVPIHTAPPE
jgi:hypothetical protein